MQKLILKIQIQVLRKTDGDINNVQFELSLLFNMKNNIFKHIILKKIINNQNDLT